MACNRLLCSIPRRMGIYACGEQQISNIGNWFLEANEFREWRGNEGGADKAVLLC